MRRVRLAVGRRLDIKGRRLTLQIGIVMMTANQKLSTGKTGRMIASCPVNVTVFSPTPPAPVHNDASTDFPLNVEQP